MKRPLSISPEAGLATALARNVRAMQERQAGAEARAGWQERLAEGITRLAGSMTFVWLHLALVAGWVAVNAGAVPGVAPFDPTFVVLATIASVEAIFITTFILISQNRAAAAADRRDELNLQISLLAEHEITRLVRLTTAIAARLGIDAAADPELSELGEDVAPEAVLDAIEEAALTVAEGDRGR